MKQYLLNILTLSLACGLLDMLTPAGEREGLRRVVRLLAGLCLLCIMIRPLTDLRDAVLSLDLGAWARGAEPIWRLIIPQSAGMKSLPTTRGTDPCLQTRLC